MKVTAIRLMRMRLPLDPPFHAAWDPVPRRHFDATLVRVETDEGVTGYGSGDTMSGFEPFEPLFTGRDPLSIANHVKTIESIGFHGGRYWPLETALWDIAGQVTGQPVSVLFGGASRRLPAYASFGEARSPQARLDRRTARLLPDRADPDRRRRLPDRPRRPRPRRRNRPRRRGPLHPVQWSMNPPSLRSRYVRD